ncbi:MAG: hypothetical protein ACOY90_05415 [Candidatus Zhuqueibacterota bacterium]
MDLFMIQTKSKTMKSGQLEKCSQCRKLSIDEILECNVYHNIMDDCYRWQEQISTCNTYQQRLDMEKTLLKKIKDGKRFMHFWKKSGYQFLITEMGLLDVDPGNLTKNEVLSIYDSIIT